MITENINTLVNYGIAAGLLAENDRIYTINKLLELFGVDDYDASESATIIVNPAEFDLEGLLKQMLDYAAEKGILSDDSIVYRDLFDTKIMGMLVPRPSEVICQFQKLYDEKGAKAATDWYYTFSQNTDYIRDIALHGTENGRQIQSMERWILLLICPNQRKIQKRLRRRKMQNRVVIQNVSSVWKMRGTLGA